MSWINHIHNYFRDKESAPASRRKKLVLELTKKGGDISITKIPALSAEISLLYSGKTQKTIARDVEALERFPCFENRRRILESVLF